MKKIISFFAAALLLFAFQTSFAQKQNTLKDWKELADFHEVLSQTYHPTEKGDFSPIKEHSKELLERAIEWNNSEIPETFKKKDNIKNILEELQAQATLVNDNIANKPDEKLKSEMETLHNIFHKIVEVCKDEVK